MGKRIVNDLIQSLQEAVDSTENINNKEGKMLRNMTSLYIMRGDEMLLLFRVGSRVVQPSWCGVGGHFEKDELNDPRVCVLREVREEIGITESDLRNIRLKYVTLRYKNGEIRQNYYFFAELSSEWAHLQECSEGILEWVAMDRLLEREMPYTAKYVIDHYLMTGKYDEIIYAGIATEQSVFFSKLNEF